jgi:hypothetical protein
MYKMVTRELDRELSFYSTYKISSLRSPGIDSANLIACVGIFEQSMGARNQVGKGFSYRPARLHRLAESILWNRFLGSVEV